MNVVQGLLVFKGRSRYALSMHGMKLFSMVFIIFLVTACTSSQVNTDNLSPEELIQKGQEASDRNKYEQAIQYYEAIIRQYPFHIDAICAAEYEIAFIHYKQKKYEIATTEFNQLLSRYNTPDEQLLPPQFKRLATIVLEKIAEKKK
jgi:outer membrane protein assembly factor BamD (BamD/ComL family)